VTSIFYATGFGVIGVIEFICMHKEEKVAKHNPRQIVERETAWASADTPFSYSDVHTYLK